MAASRAPRVLFVDSSVGFGGAIKSLALTLRALPHAGATLVTSQDPPIVRAWFPDLPVRSFRRVFNYRTTERVAAMAGPAPLRWLALKGMAAADLAVARTGARRLAHLIREGGFDLVHLNNGFLPQEALEAAQRAGVPCVVHLRDFQHERRALASPAARAVAKVIAVSDAVAASLVPHGVHGARVTTIHDPVDLALIDAAGARRREIRASAGLGADAIAVGIFGRVVRWKGQVVFARAMVEAMRSDPRLRAVIVGDQSDGSPAYFDEVRACIREAGVADRFVLAGYQRDVEPWYAAMDVVVHASVTPEPFGMVVPEAMAAGRAVVAADAGGPREIVRPGVDGLLVPPRDVHALADAVARLAADPALRASMGAAGRAAAAARFTIEANARRVAAVHAEVLGR